MEDTGKYPNLYRPECNPKGPGCYTVVQEEMEQIVKKQDYSMLLSILYQLGKLVFSLRIKIKAKTKGYRLPLAP
jgi:hypothetical protein